MIDDYAEQVQHEATRLRQLGFAICRILHGEKKPSYQRWTCASLEPADFLTFPGANLGIMGGTLSRDLIIVDGDAPKVRAVLHERLPRTAVDGRDSTGPAHWYFRVTDIPTWAIAELHVAGGLRGPRIRHFKDSQKKPIGLDWIGTGGQVVAPPSLHSSGERRRWFVDIEEIVTLPFKDLWETVSAVARDFGAVNVDCHTHPPRSDDNATRSDKIIERAIKYLSKCPPAISGQSGHDTTLVAARAIAWGFDLGAAVAFELLITHYNPRCEPPWSEAELRHKCHDADTIPYDKPRGWLRDAKRNDQQHFPLVAAHSADQPTPARIDHEPIQIHLTDRGNALRLVRQYGDVLRHCWPWRKWLVWDGTHWQMDDTGSVVRCAKQTIDALFGWATARIQQLHDAQKGADDNE